MLYMKIISATQNANITIQNRTSLKHLLDDTGYIFALGAHAALISRTYMYILCAHSALHMCVYFVEQRISTHMHV